MNKTNGNLTTIDVCLLAALAQDAALTPEQLAGIRTSAQWYDDYDSNMRCYWGKKYVPEARPEMRQADVLICMDRVIDVNVRNAVRRALTFLDLLDGVVKKNA